MNSATKSLYTLIGLITVITIFSLSIASTTYWREFNKNDEYINYSYGSYEDAHYILDCAMNEPNFEWAGENHIYLTGKKYSHFYSISVFGIVVDNVKLKLNYFEYKKFVRLLKKEYSNSVKIVTPPWKDGNL